MLDNVRNKVFFILLRLIVVLKNGVLRSTDPLSRGITGIKKNSIFSKEYKIVTLKKLFLSNVCHIDTLKLCAVTVLKLMFLKKKMIITVLFGLQT